MIETGRSGVMMMASLEIKLPSLAKDYVLDNTTDEMRNVLLLYPSIANSTISHGRAAELLGMRKAELLETIYQMVVVPEAVYKELTVNTNLLLIDEHKGRGVV